MFHTYCLHKSFCNSISRVPKTFLWFCRPFFLYESKGFFHILFLCQVKKMQKSCAWEYNSKAAVSKRSPRRISPYLQGPLLLWERLVLYFLWYFKSIAVLLWWWFCPICCTFWGKFCNPKFSFCTILEMLSLLQHLIHSIKNSYPSPKSLGEWLTIPNLYWALAWANSKHL